MIFKPADIHLWDTWCFHRSDTWYLYFLASNDWRVWDAVGVAASKDGVHWQMQGQPIRKRDDCVRLGTGSTWKSPHFARDGKFQCNFSEQPKGEPQHIYFAESKDLLHWQRCDVEFRQDQRWYEEKGRWDCIYTMPRPGGGLYGYWTATPKNAVGVGFGETDDGIHWKALSPYALDWADKKVRDAVEVGGVEKIGGGYYALLTAFTRANKEFEVVTFTAQRPEGPFRAASRNYHPLPGIDACWFPRFFPGPDGLLVTHHSIARLRKERKAVCYAAPLKRAAVDDEGTLRLMWWPGNEALKGASRKLRIHHDPGNRGSGPVFLEPAVNVRRGTILEGAVAFQEKSGSRRPGLFIACEEGAGGAIQLVSSSITAAGTMQPDGSGFAADPQQAIDRQLPAKSPARFRLLVRHSLIELYLNDVLMNVYSLPTAASGRIGLLHDAVGISDLQAWTMTLPDEAPPQPAPASPTPK
jgi:hypothetical protein